MPFLTLNSEAKQRIEARLHPSLAAETCDFEKTFKESRDEEDLQGKSVTTHTFTDRIQATCCSINLFHLIARTTNRTGYEPSNRPGYEPSRDDRFSYQVTLTHDNIIINSMEVSIEELQRCRYYVVTPIVQLNPENGLLKVQIIEVERRPSGRKLEERYTIEFLYHVENDAKPRRYKNFYRERGKGFEHLCWAFWDNFVPSSQKYSLSNQIESSSVIEARSERRQLTKVEDTQEKNKEEIQRIKVETEQIEKETEKRKAEADNLRAQLALIDCEKELDELKRKLKTEEKRLKVEEMSKDDASKMETTCTQLSPSMDPRRNASERIIARRRRDLPNHVRIDPVVREIAYLAEFPHSPPSSTNHSPSLNESKSLPLTQQPSITRLSSSPTTPSMPSLPVPKMQRYNAQPPH